MVIINKVINFTFQVPLMHVEQKCQVETRPKACRQIFKTPAVNTKSSMFYL